KRSAWRYLFKSPDIRNKLLITLGLLVVFRLAANIPVPGVDRAVVASLAQSGGAAGSLFNMLDLLSGGTVSNFSILAMGVYPYITAQIILQLLMPIIPALERMMKDNPKEGQKWMEKWTMILTIPMSFLSAFGQINIFNQMSGTTSILYYQNGDLLPTLTTIISMMGGTMFGIWIGQLISEYGIENQGLSLIIFAGIVARIPQNIIYIMADVQRGWWMLMLIAIILVLIIFAIVYIQQGRRNVLVHFPGRRIGNRQSMSVTSNLPLMVNMAGMIPLIFAQSILTFPAIVASFFLQSGTDWIKNLATSIYTTFGGSGWIYSTLYFLCVVAFTYFYTDVLFTQQDYGENLKRQGAKIPNVTAGEATQRYLHKVQQRITLPGAFFLGVVAVLPFILSGTIFQGESRSAVFLVSAAGLLIVVGVVRDTFNIIEAELKMHGYQERLLR
ncbi:MAG TPA: preprotein translocase subunit SecY, partial [Longilinea sp.]|nr:preprotein translocase subunit SecY [Longilinea sp.]